MALPGRSSTPDAALSTKDMITEDWNENAALPLGSLSAPSSVTKGHALRSRAMCSLSPEMLVQRLSRVEQVMCATPFAHRHSPEGEGMRWGRSMAFENSWTFWVDSWERPSRDSTPVPRLEKVGTCCQIKDFWSLFDHLPLSDIPVNASLHLFKNGIRPTWEDEENLHGGHFRCQVPEATRGKVWLDLALALVGEQLEGAERICGAGVTIKDYGTVLSLWISSRDPALQDMLCNQLSTMIGGRSQPTFKTHLSSIQHQAGQPAARSSGGQPPPLMHPEGAVDEVGGGDSRFRDNVAAARASQPRRRRNSAPSPEINRVSAADDALFSGAHTATFPRRGVNAPSGFAFDSPSTPVLPPAALAALPGPLRPPPPPDPRAARPGPQPRGAVRRLDAGLFGPPGAEQERGRLSTRTCGSARRSLSDSNRNLVIPTQPLSCTAVPAHRCSVGASSPLTSNGPSPGGRAPQQPSSTGFRPRQLVYNQLSQCAGASPSLAREAGAFAQASPPRMLQPWIEEPPAEPHAAESHRAWGGGGGGGQHQAPWMRRRDDPQQQQQAAPREERPPPARPTAADPRAEWQLHQRARDAQLRQQGQQQQGADRGKSAPTAGQPGQGKSGSLAFVHSGYVYPPGLNRKQRRAVIFNNDAAQRGEVTVPDGVWVGTDVPDGPVDERQYQALISSAAPAPAPGGGGGGGGSSPPLLQPPGPPAGESPRAAAPWRDPYERGYTPPHDHRASSNGSSASPQRGGKFVRVYHVIDKGSNCSAERLSQPVSGDCIDEGLRGSPPALLGTKAAPQLFADNPYEDSDGYFRGSLNPDATEFFPRGDDGPPQLLNGVPCRGLGCESEPGRRPVSPTAQRAYGMYNSAGYGLGAVQLVPQMPGPGSRHGPSGEGAVQFRIINASTFPSQQPASDFYC
eukprot:TRINITY_DN2092_c1_g1_i1.p1 TRINITY_DN2092_c1_g1~~TRINITY_DN2092_c1_g1_i1.p1  ORF type:complete len:941 (+),score=282.45 TRINITY_DN2092_c1_g1_i1:91-2823(+)